MHSNSTALNSKKQQRVDAGSEPFSLGDLTRKVARLLTEKAQVGGVHTDTDAVVLRLDVEQWATELALGTNTVTQTLGQLRYLGAVDFDAFGNVIVTSMRRLINIGNSPMTPYQKAQWK
jgi:hypothetical protein